MTKTTKKNNQIKKRLKKVVDKSKSKWYTKQVAWVRQSETTKVVKEKWSLKIEQNIEIHLSKPAIL